MSGFLFTPMTRFYAEAMEYMKNAGGKASGERTGSAGNAPGTGGATGSPAGGRETGTGSFAGTVQEQLARKEYRGESFPMGFRNGGKHTDSAKKKKQKSFWEKRAERHKMYMDLATKAWYRRENEREFQEKIALGRKEVSSAILRQQAMERATGEKCELGVNPDVLSEAATELAQSYVFFKIPSALTNPKSRMRNKI